MNMGLTYAEVEVENLFTLSTLKIRALVDSVAMFMTLPEHIAVQLGFDLTEAGMREVVLAKGRRKNVPMVGPLRVRFADRYCDLSALVLGDEPLFGAVPMEMMDLLILPGTRELSINPANPFVPVALMK
jgi:hypothetical protein